MNYVNGEITSLPDDNSITETTSLFEEDSMIEEPIITIPASTLPIMECDPNIWTISQHQQRAHEDRYQAKQIGPLQYYAIFDGHGGPNRMGPNHIADYLATHLHERIAFKLNQIDLDSQDDVVETIRKTFIDFDNELYNNDLHYGSTCTVILVHKERNRIYQVNLGDSRSIIFTEDRIVSVTKDHSPEMPSERERIVQANGRVVYGRLEGVIAVSRAFGDFEFKTGKDGYYHATEASMSSEPVITVIPISTGMYGLLTSDAPFENNYFTNDTLVSFVQQRLSLGEDLHIIVGVLANAVKIRSSDDTTIILTRI